MGAILTTMPFDYFEQHKSGALYDKEVYFLNFFNSSYHYLLLLGVFGLAIGLIVAGCCFPLGSKRLLAEAKGKVSSLVLVGALLFSMASIAEIIMQIVARALAGLHF